MFSPQDCAHMAHALRLAQRGLCSTTPNPRVGCVLVRDGTIVGEGFHLHAGEPHAEIHALAQAGEAAHGATAYVTLEPCSHHGKTGPCCDALIAAGVARVVYGMQDPNPQVSGHGLQKLRGAGIRVAGPLLETQAQVLNVGFSKRMTQGLPFVRVKMAMSLDGRTAMASGESQWITGEQARRDVQRLRAQSCAILTTATTAQADNARLTVREPELLQQLGTRRPLRVLLDQGAHMPHDAAIFSQEAPTLWCTARPAPAALPPHIEHWQSHDHDHGDNTRPCDLRALLAELARRQCNEVLVEAGATLSGRLLQAGLVDELVIYVAATLMGSTARPLFALPFDNMAQAQQLNITDVRAVGNDWRFTAVPQRV